jgi:hypothetical protein
VRLCIYLLAVSMIYALLALWAPRAAEATVIGFVALLVIPVLVEDVRAWRCRR